MKEIIEKARKFKYTAFNYIDEEDLQGADIESYSDEYICLFKEKNNRTQLCWAAISQEELLIGLKKSMENLSKKSKRTFFIEFVPEDLVEKLESMRFKVVSEWIDYWKKDLSLEGIELKRNYIIREVMKKEISEVVEIPKSCFGYSREFASGLVSDQYLYEWFEDVNSTILVAQLNESIVGFIMLNIYGHESEKGPILWIREVAVKPEYHSMGVCQALMYKGILWGKDQGAKRSFLAVDAENFNAIRAYEKFGYERQDGRGQINMEVQYES